MNNAHFIMNINQYYLFNHKAQAFVTWLYDITLLPFFQLQVALHMFASLINSVAGILKTLQCVLIIAYYYYYKKRP